MKIIFDVTGPNNLDEGTGWGISMAVGVPGNKFMMVRKGDYKQKSSALKMVKTLAQAMKTVVLVEAIISDLREPTSREYLTDKDLRKNT